MTLRGLMQVLSPVLLLCFAAERGSSTIRVIQKEISVTRALAGHVLLQGTEAPAKGVTVELCSSDWKTILTSTRTDEKGYFFLEQPRAGKVFHIRASGPGMDIYELRVRINKRATKDLTIRLSVAT